MSRMTGDDTLHHLQPGVFHCVRPAAAAAPLLFDIPRSGREYPHDFRSPAAFDEVKSSISMYVEELYGQAPEHGAAWLYACFPNAYIDANRHPRDIDPALIDGELEGGFEPSEKSRLGVGLIHGVCDSSGAPLQHTPLSLADLRRRLDGFYWPYHQELASVLADLRERCGGAYHVSCHSMASVARKVSVDAGAARPDFDIGDGHGVTCEPGFVEAVREFLAGLGYRVTVNRHFAGAESIHRHGKPGSGLHSLQIETRRGLYMDEVTYQKLPGFDSVREHLGALAGHLADYARERTGSG